MSTCVGFAMSIGDYLRALCPRRHRYTRNRSKARLHLLELCSNFLYRVAKEPATRMKHVPPTDVAGLTRAARPYSHCTSTARI